jgi:NifU-like protein involved in Fe-S cluster formation
MIYSTEVKNMCPVTQGVHHGAAPIPEEAKWVKSKEVKDISGYTHGIGWCAPQQGCCKLSLNVKEGIIQEALVETIGCSGMTHSAAMAAEILPGLTVLEALNTDLVCDAINTAMRELFLQIVYGRTQSAFSEDGLQIGAGLEDLGKGTRSWLVQPMEHLTRDLVILSLQMVTSQMLLLMRMTRSSDISMLTSAR